MKSSAYWKCRMEGVAALQQQGGRNLEGRLRRGYDDLRTTLDQELARFYGRYAANEGLTMAEARKRLSNAELEGFRLSLEEFRAKAIAGGYDRELNEIYLRSRVSRLQALQAQLDFRTRALFQDQRDLVHSHLREGFTDTYYRTVFELGKEIRIPASFARLDTAAVEQVLTRPWLEEHFSGRIWGNRDLLIRELGTTLSQGLVRGDSLDKMSRLLTKRMEVSYSRAATLVATESAHFAAEATLRGYQETGVDRYDFLASLDERTCDICGPLDGKTFKVKEQEAGVNYPPMHPRCRCTTIPHFDDEFGEPGTRAARDPETGKTVQIPADTTYEQWRGQLHSAQKLNFADATPKSERAAIQREVEQIPSKLRELAERCITSVHVADQGWSGYSVKTGELFLSTSREDGDVIHEYAHAIEASLKLYEDPGFLRIRAAGLEKLGAADIIIDTDTFTEPVYRIASDKFVSEYQGRLYERFGIYDGTAVSLDGMREYFSEGFRAYVTQPDLLERKDPDLYRYIEGLLK